MNDETKNENLPAVSDDGFDDGGDESRIIKGEYIAVSTVIGQRRTALRSLPVPSGSCSA
jgi:hypothetical protein